MPDPLPLEIGPQEFADLRRARVDHTILDVRNPWEVAICGFAQAVHIPLAELPERQAELPRRHPLVVVCHVGQRSMLAARYLRAQGFAQATSLRGGVEAWACEVDPAMARY